MNDDELHEWARRRVRQLRGLYLHVGLYVAVIAFLVVVNAMTRDDVGGYMYGGHMYHRGDSGWWVIWPAMAWGLVVAIHGLVVLLGGTGRLDAWEEHKAAQLINKEKSREKSSSGV